MSIAPKLLFDFQRSEFQTRMQGFNQAGTKARDTTTQWRPEAVGWTGLTYNRAGDEFGSVAAAPGARLPDLGDRLEFIIPHSDPSVNLYDRIHAMRGDRLEAVWPLAARRN
jgi:D-serine deaminase-like pyridoxal phosphate-dependent protein